MFEVENASIDDIWTNEEDMIRDEPDWEGYDAFEDEHYHRAYMDYDINRCIEWEDLGNPLVLFVVEALDGVRHTMSRLVTDTTYKHLYKEYCKKVNTMLDRVEPAIYDRIVKEGKTGQYWKMVTDISGSVVLPFPDIKPLFKHIKGFHVERRY